MKKKNGLCLALALLLIWQCLSFGVLATEGEGTPSETTADAAQVPTETETTAPDEIYEVAFGEASVKFGCRTLEAQRPLGGSEKLLKTSRSVFVYETGSDTVLYSYNPDEHLAPGGLVQIVNALVVLENSSLDEMVTVSTYYINQLPLGVRHVNLRNDEEISVRDLLYCMMLRSANDAAVVLAQHVAGTPEAFIDLMNQRLQEIGCTDTVLTTVSGLDEAGQYTTARDMARVIAAAMEVSAFREIFGTGYYMVEATNKSEARELKSLNYLLDGADVSKFYDERVTGGKASYISSAVGAAIGFTAQTEELDLVCVLMGATRKNNADGTISRYGNFEEAGDLLDHCFNKFRVSRMLFKGQSMIQLEVDGGANDVVAVNSSSIDIVLPKGTGLEDLKLQYDVIGGKLTAPVEKNQAIATLQMWCGDSCVGETTLYAMSDVATADDPGYVVQNGASRSDADMAQILMFLGIVLLVIFIPVSIYLIVNHIRKAAAKKRARQLRRQRRDQRMERRRRHR